MSTKTILLLAFSLIVLVLGIIMLKSGKPYNAIFSAIHKIASVGLAIVFGFYLYEIFQGIQIATSHIVWIVITSVFFVVSVASGSLLLSESTWNAWVLWAHRIATPVTFILGLYMLFMLKK